MILNNAIHLKGIIRLKSHLFKIQATLRFWAACGCWGLESLGRPHAGGFSAPGSPYMLVKPMEYAISGARSAPDFKGSGRFGDPGFG